LKAFTRLKSVDHGKFSQAFYYFTSRKETAPSAAGTTGFVQLVHVATCYSAWTQLEEVITH